MKKMSLKFLVDRGEIKGSETFVRFIFPKQNVAPVKQHTSFLIVTLKCCCLPGKFGKHIRFATFLFTRSTKFPLFFSNLEPAHS